MTNNLNKKYDNMHILSVIYVLIVIFGHIGTFEIRIFGVVPTLYRLCIPVMFFFCIYLSFKNKLSLKKESVFKLFFLTMIFWIVYGFVSLFISPWSDFNTGIKELMNIALGICVVYIAAILCIFGKCDFIFVIIKIIIAFFLIVGIWEILMGYHLGVSRFNDPEFIQNFIINGHKEVPRSYIATGIFYNENDYCAFLSIFAVVLLKDDEKKCIYKVINYIMIGLIFLILLVDDAWISFISLIIGIAFYLIITKASWIKCGILAILCGLSVFVGKYIVSGTIFLLYEITGNEIFKRVVTVSNPGETLMIQTGNMTQGMGSMFGRINTYIEGIKEMFMQSKGLGLGAGSFTAYFEPIAEEKKMMSNPHSIWIEIISQYGLIIFVLFVVSMICLFLKLFKFYVFERNVQYAIILSIGVTFMFASFAPSSFLGNSYYWMPIGMGLGMIILPNVMKPKGGKSEDLTGKQCDNG